MSEHAHSFPNTRERPVKEHCKKLLKKIRKSKDQNRHDPKLVILSLIGRQVAKLLKTFASVVDFPTKDPAK